MSLRAIVFDFDGVIANSEPLHFQAFRDLLAGEGVTLSKRDYYDRYLGFDDAGVFRAVGVETMRIDDLVKQKAVRLEALERDVSILFPGAAAAIRRLAASVPLAIASGAIGAEIRRVLEREHLSQFFAAVVSADDTAKSKPAPDPYLRVVAQLDAACGGRLAARECVAIEDSRWGLESARTAGLKTVGISHTYDARTLSADLVIDALDRLEIGSLRSICSD
ncbi:MAG TPA: HAD family phosphatase [Vicinamibacterales bacterium]|nr:HAD family phosphatase [Vicinamibacterales bacterium]